MKKRFKAYRILYKSKNSQKREDILPFEYIIVEYVIYDKKQDRYIKINKKLLNSIIKFYFVKNRNKIPEKITIDIHKAEAYFIDKLYPNIILNYIYKKEVSGKDREFDTILYDEEYDTFYCLDISSVPETAKQLAELMNRIKFKPSKYRLKYFKSKNRYNIDYKTI